MSESLAPGCMRCGKPMCLWKQHDGSPIGWRCDEHDKAIDPAEFERALLHLISVARQAGYGGNSAVRAEADKALAKSKQRLRALVLGGQP